MEENLGLGLIFMKKFTLFHQLNHLQVDGGQQNHKPNSLISWYYFWQTIFVRNCETCQHYPHDPYGNGVSTYIDGEYAGKYINIYEYIAVPWILWVSPTFSLRHCIQLSNVQTTVDIPTLNNLNWLVLNPYLAAHFVHHDLHSPAKKWDKDTPRINHTPRWLSENRRDSQKKCVQNFC